MDIKTIMNKSIFNKDGFEIPYRVYLPEKITEDCHFILYLHGAGERGSDNTKHIENNKQFIERYFSEKYDEKKPSVIIAPQCPEHYPDGREGKWVDKDWGTGSYTGIKEETLGINAVISLCNYYINKYSIKKENLIVTGISMGGFGTWDIITRYPGMFKTAVPVCGGGSITEAYKAEGTRIWTFHGDADDTVPVSATRDMVNALKNAGIDIRYTEYKGVNHGSWDPAYKEPELFQWIFDF